MKGNINLYFVVGLNIKWQFNIINNIDYGVISIINYNQNLKYKKFWFENIFLTGFVTTVIL